MKIKLTPSPNDSKLSSSAAFSDVPSLMSTDGQTSNIPQQDKHIPTSTTASQPSPQHTLRKPLIPATEIRIGLVLYGGVSLAVYMNGVVQELLSLVRAQRGADIDRLNNPYADILQELGCEVTIDIIAGNSAGGINGVLLAKALASGADLKVVANLWRNVADLKALLNVKDQTPDSLLNGQYMLNQLQVCFDNMRKEAEEDPALAEARKSQIPVLDLFIAASDIRGRRWTAQGSNHIEMEGLTHDVLFRRKLRTRYGTNKDRGYERNDFEGTAQEELLARISRATSAMPGAFPAQPFEMSEVYGTHAKYDSRNTVYLHDGLMTDNRPFTPVLETIQHRTADRKIKRWLIFLDPNPDIPHLMESTEQYNTKPDPIESALSYVSIPRYQSIYRQVRKVNAHQRTITGLNDVLSALDKPAGKPTGPSAISRSTSGESAAPQPVANHSTWTTETAATVQSAPSDPLASSPSQSAGAPLVSNPLASGPSTTAKYTDDEQANVTANIAFQPAFPAYCQLRVENLGEAYVDALTDYLRKVMDTEDVESHTVLTNFKKEWKQHFTPSVLSEHIMEMKLPDIEFYCRFVSSNLRTINKQLEVPDLPPQELILLMRHKDALWTLIEELRQLEWQWWNDTLPKEMAQLNNSIESSPLNSTLRTGAVARAREQLIHAGSPQTTMQEPTFIQLMEEMHQSIWSLLRNACTKPLIAAALGLQPMKITDNPGFISKKAPSLSNQLQSALVRYLAVDLFVFPLTVDQPSELNPIELLRIASSDATSLGLSGSQKLIGGDLHAFAGFLDTKWRANDLMWGRLDTADIVLSYMDCSYKEAKSHSQDELALWNLKLEGARTALFDRIITEELPYVGEEWLARYQAFMSNAVSEGAGRLATMREFFTKHYTVGEQTWKSLPPAVTINRTIQTIQNAHTVLYQHYRHSWVPRLFIGTSSIIWRTTGWLARQIFKE